MLTATAIRLRFERAPTSCLSLLPQVPKCVIVNLCFLRVFDY